MRVLAAMSGGVDSAVAAALAVDAGHDVTGVHLALSPDRQTLRSGARGCCSVEDAHDARRVADELGIPFYVWDLADRFAEDVVDDFVAEYAAGRTPNPCLRCNEKIKFTAVLDRARALGFDAVVTGHHARLDGTGLRRSVDAAKDQSYVLGVLTPRAARHRAVPARLHDQGARAGDRRRARLRRRRRSPTRTTSASSPTATPGASSPAGSAAGPARSSTRPPAPTVGEHDGTYGFTVGQRRGLGVAVGDQQPRYVLGIEPVSRTVTIGTQDLAGVDEVHTGSPTWTGAVPALPFAAQVQLRAHGTPVACGSTPAPRAGCGSLDEDQRGVAPGSRRCSTSPTPTGAPRPGRLPRLAGTRGDGGR